MGSPARARAVRQAIRRAVQTSRPGVALAEVANTFEELHLAGSIGDNLYALAHRKMVDTLDGGERDRSSKVSALDFLAAARWNRNNPNGNSIFRLLRLDDVSDASATPG